MKSPEIASARRKMDPRDPATWPFRIEVKFMGGLLPWSAFITHGIAMVGEPGSGTYASRTPEKALRRAMKTVSKIAADTQPDQIIVEVEYRGKDWRDG